MPEFERSHSETEAAGIEATRATACLPGLDIEIVRRRAAEVDAEQISIRLTAAPSFAAFGRALEAADLFGFWAQVARLAWQPWLTATPTMVLPWPLAMLQLSAGNASCSASEHALAGGTRRPAPP